MTGFGEAHRRNDGLAVVVEARAINNRFFKLATRISDGYGSLESQIEDVVRASIHRGTIQVNIRIERRRSPDSCKINAEALDCYRRQLDSLVRQWGIAQPIALDALLALPGVADEAEAETIDAAADWPTIESTLQSALENLGRMRAKEGQAMAADLDANCRAVAASLDRIAKRAPLVVEDYRHRLHERLQRALAEFQVTLDPADLIKEVGLFADRSDISEEIVRLRSHLDQFHATMQSVESAGRKLDFLTQEMFRETNTIGSKANDVEIARDVIEIKTIVERIREMIQNIE